MITMKRARQQAPADPDRGEYEERVVHYGTPLGGVDKLEYVKVQNRTLIEPFKVWARKRFASTPPNELSPKLRKIVHGKRA